MSTDHNSSDILQQLYWKELDATNLATAEKEQAQNALTAIRTVLVANYTEKVAIKSDGDLNEIGKNKKLVALVQRSDSRLDAVTQTVIANLQEKTVGLNQSIQNSTVPPSDATSAVLMVERRRLLSKMDALTVGALIEKLAGDGSDDLTVHAAMTAAPFTKIAHPKNIAQARTLMANRMLPDKSEQLRQATESLAIINNALAAAKREVSTPIERAALAA